MPAVASAEASWVVSYPNAVLDDNCPIAGSAVVCDTGLHYVPENDLQNYVLQKDKGDYCVINLFEGAGNRRHGEQIKFCVMEYMNVDTNKKYVGITFIDPEFAMKNYKSADRGMKEINRDVGKLSKANKLTTVTPDYIETRTNICRKDILLLKKKQNGNDGAKPIMFLYEIP